MPTTAASRTFGIGVHAALDRCASLLRPSLRISEAAQACVDAYFRRYAVSAGLHVKREYLRSLWHAHGFPHAAFVLGRKTWPHSCLTVGTVISRCSAASTGVSPRARASATWSSRSPG